MEIGFLQLFSQHCTNSYVMLQTVEPNLQVVVVSEYWFNLRTVPTNTKVFLCGL